MPTTAVLTAKRFTKAKQRLEAELGAGTRTALAAAMFSDVLSALDRSESVETVLLVSGEPTVQDLAVEREVVLIRDTTEKGQSQAALSGLARAAALGYDRALVVPGDCPLMNPSEIDDLIRSAAAEAHDLVIVPDRHQVGTNALLLSPSGPFEPQFGPDSLSRHVEQAERRDLRYKVESVRSLALDIDTAEDAAELEKALTESHGRAQRTQGVLRQIERSRPRPPVAA